MVCSVKSTLETSPHATSMKVATCSNGEHEKDVEQNGLRW